jgi:hypothetical protein
VRAAPAQGRASDEEEGGGGPARSGIGLGFSLGGLLYRCGENERTARNRSDTRSDGR